MIWTKKSKDEKNKEADKKRDRHMVLIRKNRELVTKINRRLRTVLR